MSAARALCQHFGLRRVHRLVEGIGAGRQTLRPHLARLLWRELPYEEVWTLGSTRDGEEQRSFWVGWIEVQRRHFAEDPSRPLADLPVRQGAEGHEVLPGPICTSGPDQDITHSDGLSAVR